MNPLQKNALNEKIEYSLGWGCGHLTDPLRNQRSNHQTVAVGLAN